MSIFVIAEAGSNFRAGPHDEAKDMARALALIDVAAGAGADACKVQFWSDSSNVYAGSTAGELDEVRLPGDWLPKLATQCKRQRIEFMASVFHPADVPIVDPFVRRHKIASYELSYEALVRAVARTCKPLIISTGAHTHDEVVRTVDWVVDAQPGCDLTIMHCCAAYPAPAKALNLRAIGSWPGLRVGYSDHSAEWWTPIAAVALGATTIEKHFTLDRTSPGPDHAFALEPAELRQMVEAVRATEVMLGVGERRITPTEEPLRRSAVRRVQALRNLVPGALVIEGETVACLRPGEKEPGAWAHDLAEMHNRHLRVAIATGDGVRLEDVE